MNDVVCLIMGGGRGTRLHPLTLNRSKPAVPIAGKFRLVDIPISNCLHSNIRKILVLTQFNSASLNRHVGRTYHLDGFSGGFVDIMAAEQTPENMDWFQGTADAVRQSLQHIVDHRPRQVLILSGDHLYRMNYGNMVMEHRERGVPVTLSVTSVPRERTSDLGIVRVDREGRVVDFLEKPKDPAQLEGYELPSEILGEEPEEPLYAGSMGVYVFDTRPLIEILSAHPGMDFGKEIIPMARERWAIGAHVFRDYWEDIGTIRNFFEAHLHLTEDPPPIDFHDPSRPFFTHQRYLPAAVIDDSRIERSIVSDGSVVRGATLRNSVVGVRGIVREDSSLESVIHMGADDYEDESSSTQEIPLGVGRRCRIERTIIDKNARIGDDVVIEKKDPGTSLDAGNYYVREGITIVVKNGFIPSGSRI
jgi:glucose-1-phosphate adenylyltransferase